MSMPMMAWGTRGMARWEVVAVVAVAEMEMMVSGDGGGKGGELMSVAAMLSDAE